MILDISLEKYPKPTWIGGSPVVSYCTGGGVSDIDQSEKSSICQRSVEMVGRQRWNGWWCDRKRNTLPYISRSEMFRNGIDVLIFWSRPFEIFPIWLLIYTINFKLDHRPILKMVVSLSPLSFKDMAPTARREWTPTRYELIPSWCSFRVVTENQMAVIKSVGLNVA